MSALKVTPFEYLTDTNGDPLDAGYIYIGVVNLDPETNPIDVFYDVAMTIPAVQPIRTINGYVVNAGAPATLYIASNYSVRVRNSALAQLYYVADFYARQASYQAAFADLAAANGSSLIGYQSPSLNTVAQTQQAFNRRIISPYDFGAVGDGVVDDTVALQNFLTEIVKSPNTLVTWYGIFKVSADLICTSASTHLTILADFRLNATHTSSGTILTFQNIAQLRVVGQMTVYGAGSTTYTSRKNDYCVAFLSCSRAYIDRCMTFYGRVGGIYVNNNGYGSNDATMTQFGKLQIGYCGTVGSGATGVAPTFTWNANNGSSGSTIQSSTITLSTPVLGIVPTDTLCTINGQPYMVSSVDDSNTVVNVYPWLPSTVTSGTVQFALGYGFKTQGSNSASITVGTADITGCGQAIFNGALYPSIFTTTVLQSNQIGHRVGYSRINSSVGGSTQHSYWESNACDIVQTGAAPIGYNFLSTTALNLGKCWNLQAPRLSSDLMAANSSMFSGAVGVAGYTLTPTRVFVPSIDPLYPDPQYISVGAGGLTVPIAANFAPNGFMGYQTFTAVMFGATSPNNAPLGVTTITPPAGYTVNGGASYAFNATVAPLRIVGYLNGTNFVVWGGAAPSISYTTATFTVPSLAPGTCSQIQTVAVAGVSLGDLVTASGNKNMGGLGVRAWVSAAGTVSYMIDNPLGNPTGTVVLGATTFRFCVTDLT